MWAHSHKCGLQPQRLGSHIPNNVGHNPQRWSSLPPRNRVGGGHNPTFRNGESHPHRNVGHTLLELGNNPPKKGDHPPHNVGQTPQRRSTPPPEVGIPPPRKWGSQPPEIRVKPPPRSKSHISIEMGSSSRDGGHIPPKRESAPRNRGYSPIQIGLLPPEMWVTPHGCPPPPPIWVLLCTAGL